jgi:hypothetical protein
MCTSIVVNGKKTLFGFNFDNPGWKYHIVTKNKAFYISLLVNEKLWVPTFGCNARGDFATLPAMNPGVKEGYYQKGDGLHYIDQINLAFLLERITLAELTAIVKANPIYNEEHLSLQAQDADGAGNVLQIFPGLGYKSLAKPAYSVLTNFQLMKEEKEHHPWAGVDRYEKANAYLEEAKGNVDVPELMTLLKETAQVAGGAPTMVSFVYDVAAKRVVYVEKQNWDHPLELFFDQMGHSGRK